VGGVGKKRMELPCAVWEGPMEDLNRYVGWRVCESGFSVVELESCSNPMLWIVSQKACRILLIPGVRGKDRTKVEKCCDKGCSGCRIPMRNRATMGHFLGRRIRKRLKKEKWAAAFYSDRWQKALKRCDVSWYVA